MALITGLALHGKAKRWISLRTVAAALFAILLGLEVLALEQIPGVNHAVVLATSHQIEPITELYVSDVKTLPKTFSPGTNQAFAFQIHNLVGTDTTYRYQITVNGVAESGVYSVEVPNGQVRTIATGFVVNDSSARAEVVVTLLDQHQSIHFWSERI